MTGERQSPTHTVCAQTEALVAFRLPHNIPQAGDDRVLLSIGSDALVTMSRQDWQQFVACVAQADKQVQRVFNRAGRPLGEQPLVPPTAGQLGIAT